MSQEAGNSNNRNAKPMLLNIGCGRRYHSDWVNLDLESSDSSVICHDVTKGIPFGDNKFTAVYHSHVLEHLDPEHGKRLIEECFRVLKPGGVLRIVVPDLERIAKLYLEMHDQAWSGTTQSKVNYNWMKLELLDQLVRRTSGGNMGRYMASNEIENSDFVRARVGDELDLCQSAAEIQHPKPTTFLKRVTQATLGIRQSMVRRFVRLVLGAGAVKAFDEGLFRSQGEIHRWMYDRFSLRELSASIGFQDFKVCEADESQIEDYATFDLDCVGAAIRKPDSIFIECLKPNPALAAKSETLRMMPKQTMIRAAG